MNPCNRTNHVRAFVILIGAGAVSLAVACGSSNSSGSSGTPPQTHCDPFTTTDSPIAPLVCSPQLKSRSACGAEAACSWVVEVPCTASAASDAGKAADAGETPDASADPCIAICNAARPAGTQPVTFCTTTTPDGSATITAHCGACGI